MVNKENGEKEVNITYETIFELLRREKSREDLQEMSPAFFDDVIVYLKEKSKRAENSQTNLFSEEESEKTRIQLLNIKKMLRELYDRREKKIMNMAINKARTKSNLINTSTLLKEEQELFLAVSKVLENFREGVIENVVNSKTPCSVEVKEKQERSIEIEAGKDVEDPVAAAAGPEQKASCLTLDIDMKCRTVRFLNPLPSFAGPDLRIYGPFDSEDIASLPEKVASLLVEKGRAEFIGSDED